MSTEQTQTPETASQATKLTINDPVDAETLKSFGELQAARGQMSERLLDLEMEKVRTLRAASNIDSERQRLFEKVLMDRGLPPNAPVEIDAKTGKITMITPPAPPNGNGQATPAS